LTNLKEWKADLDRTREEITLLVWSTDIHERLRAIVSANPAVNMHNQFYDWLSRSYVDSQLVGLRRQLDLDKRSVSLANLIGSMAKHPELLSREAHLSLYSQEMQFQGNHTFNLLAGAQSTTYPAAKLHGALRALERVRSVHGKYINKRLAHSDRAPLSGPLPTFRDLNAAVRKLEKLVIHYHLLFTAQSYNSLVPVPDYDWEAIFRLAWLPPAPRRRGA
jgi:hypothetical protein